MNLLSTEFLILLAIAFVLFYLIGLLNKLFKKVIIPQWSILLIASLVFYGFVNPIYLIYLGVSSLFSYAFALMVQHKLFKKISSANCSNDEFVYSPVKVDDHLSRRVYENILTTMVILINVGILAVLKYYNFFAGSVNSIFHVSAPTFNFIIPLGISFYTFSLIAYNVDCCKRVTIAEKNPLKFLLFVSYFPKILQGPISSYDKLKEDGLFAEHGFKDNDYLKSFFRISVGLIKKIAIANVLNLYVNAAYANLENYYGVGLLLVSLLYTIQLYCDFSGFLDITIGISGLFGIKLEENFSIPYISASIQEFWRRWHITLGTWLKKYIYIPLGGNRVPIWRWVINILIVWLVSGIWHGANWTFIVWGLFHGILLVINGLPKQIQKRKGITPPERKRNPILFVLSVIGTFILVNFSWVLFRSDNITQAGRFFVHMIKVWVPNQYSLFSDTSISSANWLLIISSISIVTLIGIRAIIHYQTSLLSKIKYQKTVSYISTFAITVIFFSISIFVFLYLNSIGGGESSFIYFDF